MGWILRVQPSRNSAQKSFQLHIFELRLFLAFRQPCNRAQHPYLHRGIDESLRHLPRGQLEAFDGMDLLDDGALFRDEGSLDVLDLALVLGLAEDLRDLPAGLDRPNNRVLLLTAYVHVVADQLRGARLKCRVCLEPRFVETKCTGVKRDMKREFPDLSNGRDQDRVLQFRGSGTEACGCLESISHSCAGPKGERCSESLSRSR
jgi:hypothetical protein